MVILFLGSAAWGQEATLKEKGLEKSGTNYVLPGEAAVSTDMKKLRAAKKQMDDDAKGRAGLEEKIKMAKGAIGSIEYEERNVQQKLTTESGRAQQNQLIARINVLQSQLKEAGEFKAAQEAKLRSLGEASKTAFIDLVIDLADKVEQTSKQYEELAGDAQVKVAFEKINGPGKPKMKLGPSPEYVANATQIKKWRGDVSSQTISLLYEGNVPLVEVTINNKLVRQMAVDSGASLVALPSEMAEELNLNPGPNDPTLHMQLADGKIVEAKKMTLKSVRLGAFVVQDVECAVMPKNLTAAQALLGGSFLGNFIYKVDPQAKELHLALLAGGNKQVSFAPPQGSGKTPSSTSNVPKSEAKAGTATPDAPASAAANAQPKQEVATSNTPSPKTTTNVPNTPPAVGADVKRILAYLEGEYNRKLESPDWRMRAFAVVSLAKLPQPEVRTKLLQLVDTDKHDMVRLLAWEAVLARASELNSAEHARWMNSTLVLAEKGAFKGRLRVALLNVLSTSPMTTRSRKVFEKIANETNAWESTDIPVLRALGSCLAKWKSGSIVEALINAMGQENSAPRAEFILQQAGSPVPPARNRLPASVFDPRAPDRSHISSIQMWQMAQQDYAAWIKKDRANWREVTAMPDEPWKTLQPLFVPAPVAIEDVRPTDPAWTAELELGKANVGGYEVCFCVDATGSMGDVLAWLSRDLITMSQALSAMALEPRIGITFYRDHDDDFVVKSLPLTGNVATLVQAVQTVGANGGGDIPEAVLEGLKDAIGNNRWNTKRDGSKVIILVGDAPPHEKDIRECISIAAEAKKNGFKIYAIKVTTSFGANDLTSFDQIAAAGGGPAIDAVFRQLSHNFFVDPTGKEIPFQTIDRPEAQTVIAPMPYADHPGERILTQILSDAINPQYRDRLEPVVRTLLAACEPVSPPEVRRGFPANTPTLQAGKRVQQ